MTNNKTFYESIYASQQLRNASQQLINASQQL